jgi:hypothetical protein
MVNAHRQVILIEGTAAVEATINKNTGSSPVLTTEFNIGLTYSECSKV